VEAIIDEASAWYIPNLLGDHDVDVSRLPSSFTRLFTVLSARFCRTFGAGVREHRILVTNAT
jgi:hypothetical protein